MRKVWLAAAITVGAMAMGIGTASATTQPLLSGTASFSDSGTAQLVFTSQCLVTDSIDGTYNGQFVANPVNTPVESGSFHIDLCGNFISANVIADTGTVTIKTLGGTINATVADTVDFTTGAINGTWTVTGGTGAYTNAKGTISESAQGAFTSALSFVQSGTLSFSISR